MLSVWRYVVVGAVIAAAILTPSTDPLTQLLLAGPLMGLYLGGAWTEIEEKQGYVVCQNIHVSLKSWLKRLKLFGGENSIQADFFIRMACNFNSLLLCPFQ